MTAVRKTPPAEGRRFESEMRTLRSQLQTLLESRKPTLLAVTACNFGEGAGTVARGLCRSLALDGVKVLYCGRWDGGLRTPFSSETPNASERSIIRSSIPTLCYTDISDLHGADVRVSAPIVFRDWLETVKHHFDVIVTETPPILNRPAAGPLMPIQDGVLLVMEAEQTRASVLKTTITAIEVAGGHILGIVFNRRKKYIPEVFYRWV
jgi:Mrp family chromosome partitioning ATPase